ncbi:nucleotide-binding protein [Lichenicoccus roseus]|uniref:MinD/ParA family protein n=1 Tax=Lichenicoccus roseus TaxID=2683649 RepID=A0A5R9IYE0_9PROT|nr:AAA family ATPase [Lichenicoccus roseus]TLU70504.1 MinD/ParA family protein [Lichenicoccus roseus]
MIRDDAAQVEADGGGPAGLVTAIASGKGGVGKTWLSITLAQSLAMAGHRVLLFDGDFGLANVDIQLGFVPEYDLSDVASKRVPLARAIVAFGGGEAAAASGGFGILPGRSGTPVLSGLSVPDLDGMLSALRGLRGYDTILLDLGAGIDRTTRRLAAWADTLLVVTTDEPTALTDAYAVLKLHARDRQIMHGADLVGSDARIVVNQAASVVSGQKTYTTLSRACANFLGRTPPLAGIIRRDPSVRDAIRRQTPLLTRFPNSAAACDVRGLGAVLRC